MTKKIFRSIFLVAMAVLLACLAVIMGVLYEHYTAVQEQQLKTGLALAAEGVELGGADYLQALDERACRLTLVSDGGEVLFDTQGIAGKMENHAQREEIREAMESGAGESVRYSSTLMEQTLYCARRLPDGSVLRISVSRVTVVALILAMLQPMAIVTTIALLLSALLAKRLAQNIVKPLNALDLDEPLENDTYDELAPILTRLEQQHRQIQMQRQELQDRRNEFLAVTGHMSEGLVLLGRDGVILSMNPSAAAFFGAAGEHAGESFLALERDHEIGKLIKKAEAGGYGEAQLSRNGREYQLRANRVEAGGEVSGVVLLIFDATEKVLAEHNRREFTANVSHELKTPLQSIMGSAELLENGLVKPEDVPRFVGRIRAEAGRLVALIEDIIRLSQLDEGGRLPMEQVDLLQAAEDVAGTLADAAAAKNVTLTVEGASVTMKSVRRLVTEILFNLCDNAIKYNVAGGHVTVAVKAEGRDAVLTVADTGIGIPAAHQSRVFERFYRVDKSHSRESGGTGLGLSIVKHAVQYLGGRIELKSEPGKGTTVQVCFAL